MAKPVFIVCAKSGSVDRFTNLASLYHIVEKFTGHKRLHSGPAEKAIIPDESDRISFRAMSVWKREDEDEGNEFEHHFVLRMPGTPDKEFPNDNFAFSSKVHRFVFDITLANVPGESGAIEVISRVRAIGTIQWTTQSYEIELEVVDETKTEDVEPKH